MKKLLNIICRIVGHKTFNDGSYECCLRCDQHEFYNYFYYYTIPGLFHYLKFTAKWIWDKRFTKDNGLPF